MIASLTVDPKLGFIGIGSMGQPIARRLLQAGYKVSVYNRDRTKAEALAGSGATVKESVAVGSRVRLECVNNLIPF